MNWLRPLHYTDRILYLPVWKLRCCDSSHPCRIRWHCTSSSGVLAGRVLLLKMPGEREISPVQITMKASKFSIKIELEVDFSAHLDIEILQLLTFWGCLLGGLLIQELENNISVIFFWKSWIKLFLFSYLVNSPRSYPSTITTHLSFLLMFSSSFLSHPVYSSPPSSSSYPRLGIYRRPRAYLGIVFDGDGEG